MPIQKVKRRSEVDDDLPLMVMVRYRAATHEFPNRFYYQQGLIREAILDYLTSPSSHCHKSMTFNT